MPLLLLAHRPDWAVRLRACLQGSAHAEQLVVATDWQTVSQQLESPCLVLATPQCRPAPGRFPWPLILLLDEEPEETPEGAVDWLVADQLSAEVLRRCLRYVRERCNLQGTLQKLAVRDPHTGIANRQGFQAQLLDALSEHDGHGLELGYLDLDNFRHVNDALGHDAGDRLILQVVNRLKAQLEPGDALARLGSDEFALLMLNAGLEEGRAKARQLAAALAEGTATPEQVTAAAEAHREAVKAAKSGHAVDRHLLALGLAASRRPVFPKEQCYLHFSLFCTIYR